MSAANASVGRPVTGSPVHGSIVAGGLLLWFQLLSVVVGGQGLGAVVEQEGSQAKQDSEVTRLDLVPARERDDVEWLTVSDSTPWPRQRWVAADLPKLPAEWQAAWDLANVEVHFYNDKEEKRRFRGETRFILTYGLDYNVQMRVVRRGRETLLRVRTQLKPIEFKFRHQILLPFDDAVADWFQRPLPRHEWDHVRISLDERYRHQFQQVVEEELKDFTISLTREETLDMREERLFALAQRRIEEVAKKQFESTLQLIEVRNRELDKTTGHGRKPLPAGFFDVSGGKDSSHEKKG
jgi:hypothetical protein